MKRRKKKRLSLRKFLETYLTYYPFRRWLLWVKRLRLESLGFYGEKFGAIALYLPGQEVGKRRGQAAFIKKLLVPFFLLFSELLKVIDKISLVPFAAGFPGHCEGKK